MKESEKAGLQNAARFAIQPNMWGFCGEDESQEILRNLVSEKEKNYEAVKETLHDHGFPHLNAFLETIAEATGLDTYEDELVMSYWIGNDLTEKSGVDKREVLVEKYKEQIPGVFGQRLSEVLPEKIFLTHLSQVALIAMVDYEQPEKTRLINHCMLAYGKIIEIDLAKKEAVVNRDILKKKTESGYEVVSGNQTVKIDTDLTPAITAGDEVTIHLGYLAAKLSDEQVKSLKYWTRKVAKLI
jgi:hypothetical protein